MHQNRSFQSKLHQIRNELHRLECAQIRARNSGMAGAVAVTMSIVGAIFVLSRFWLFLGLAGVLTVVIATVRTWKIGAKLIELHRQVAELRAGDDGVRAF